MAPPEIPAAPASPPEAGTGLDLPGLLHPLTPGQFFAEHYQRRWLHVPGPAARGSSLLEGEAVRRALATPGSAGGRARFHGPRPGDDDALRRYLNAGNPVLWESALGLSVAMDDACATLATAFGGLVWPNVYWTGPRGAPLPMHFDPHDVWIVQCEGKKRWRISSLQVRGVLDRPEMRDANFAALDAGRAAASERIDADLVACPGDVLYLPRGTFHAASTPADRSLHVTFGVQPLTGVDIVDALASLALANPRFREYLPAPAEDASGVARHKVVAELRARLAQMLDDNALDRELRVLCERLVARSTARE